jgi:imidazolonepropionase-like amidohydrolase
MAGPTFGLGEFTIADGVPEVLGAVHAELKKEASQIKLAAGGGVISDFDPIDSIQFTPEELKAAVEAANDWGTYVAVHIYTVAGIRRRSTPGCFQSSTDPWPMRRPSSSSRKREHG